MSQGQWTLRLHLANLADFELQFDGVTCYSGVLEVVNNGRRLSLEDINWHYRHKTQRLELWCQLYHTDTLSLNLNYSFTERGLAIEYLARNAVPTRLDVCHVIDASKTGKGKRLAGWYRQHDGQPSDDLTKIAKTDVYLEAFCARQWVVLENVRDTDETLS